MSERFPLRFFSSKSMSSQIYTGSSGENTAPHGAGTPYFSPRSQRCTDLQNTTPAGPRYIYPRSYLAILCDRDKAYGQRGRAKNTFKMKCMPTCTTKWRHSLVGGTAQKVRDVYSRTFSARIGRIHQRTVRPSGVYDH